ncbi:MAG: hypothetical protein V4556_08200 [Bacteroidota bacterium]
MDNSFEVPVTHNGHDYLFPATLITYGYSYKIEVDVSGTIIIFEPDDEGNYRALINEAQLHDIPHVNKELLQLIAEKLQALFS